MYDSILVFAYKDLGNKQKIGFWHEMKQKPRKLTFGNEQNFDSPFSQIPAEGKIVVLPSVINLSIDHPVSKLDWTRSGTRYIVLVWSIYHKWKK